MYSGFLDRLLRTLATLAALDMLLARALTESYLKVCTLFCLTTPGMVASPISENFLTTQSMVEATKHEERLQEIDSSH